MPFPVFGPAFLASRGVALPAARERKCDCGAPVEFGEFACSPECEARTLAEIAAHERLNLQRDEEV